MGRALHKLHFFSTNLRKLYLLTDNDEEFENLFNAEHGLNAGVGLEYLAWVKQEPTQFFSSNSFDKYVFRFY